ncbi:MAG TPA: hypothetical protein VN611_16150 [Patescibacteria group bacterium]|nr:hypothetical protein [Patescibacteria group bacterium]
MGELYRVAIHYDNDCGFVEYDTAEKQLRVLLDHEEKRRETEAYLMQRHTIRKAGQRLLDFSEVDILPVDNLEDLKLALTRLWQKTGVYVDWSRPVA